MNRRLMQAALIPFSLMLATPGIAGEFPDEYFFSAADRPASLKALEGKPAAELELDAWIGDETSLEELRGQVVIVDFWATWCGPCMAAIPKNVALVDQYGDQGFSFIGVHDSNGGWDKADSVVADKKINYPVARDADGKSVKAYGLSFWPTYVAIDRKGIVRAAGLVPGKVEDVVKILLEEPGGPGITAATESEFPVDWYVGGEKRLPSLSVLEGQPAPGITATSESEWIGDPSVLQAREGRITVLRFLAPANKNTREALPAWKKTADAFSQHGVVFIGVCDHFCEWQEMQDLVDPANPPFPIVRDLEPEKGELPLGRTASSYGVRMWPTTVVIDRAGRVRASGIKDEQLKAVIEKLMIEPVGAPLEREPHE